jgi:hypothetical protein
MKTWPVGSVAFLFAIGASFAAAQEEEPEDDELTPAQAMELLGDAHGMMVKAEELLNDSSRGKALETERKLIERLERELKDEKGILAKVGKLIEKAEKKEKDAADKLAEIIKKAKTSSGSSNQSAKDRQKQEQGRQAKQPGNPAVRPYQPNRVDEPSKFQSYATKTGSWGNLPPAVRAAMLAASKEELPPEFQEIWKKYTESMQDSNK